MKYSQKKACVHVRFSGIHVSMVGAVHIANQISEPGKSAPQHLL